MLLYAVTKFIAYCLRCLLGLRLFTPTHVTLLSTIKYGLLRWLIGLGFGLFVAMALGSVSPESVTSLYVSVYAPLRVAEWTIIAVLMQRSVMSVTASFRSARSGLWVIGGVGVSFLSDLASPDGIAGRFCVGRCLC